MVWPRADLPAAVETSLAFVVGVVWYAAVTTCVAWPLPGSVAVTTGVVFLAVAVVLATARWWDISYAVTIGVASVVALDWYFIPPTHPIEVPDAPNFAALAGYLLMASLLGELAVRARRRAVQVEEARSALAGEHEALRRVATLVARQPAPQEVFDAVTEEVGRQLHADLATMIRYHADGRGTVAATWSDSGTAVPVGTGLALVGDHIAATVRRTGRPARIDSFDGVSGPWADTLRSLGVRASAGCPITVDGTVWGVMVAASRSPKPFPPGTETRLGEFTDLVATAVANAQARADLVASRARLVAAADEARRRIERDLHDGVQQRLVSLALGARLAGEAAGDRGDIRSQIVDLECGLRATAEELRDLSHGIHPAVLTEGGLRPALRALARRSPVAVEVEAEVGVRLPEPVEVGLYYVASEGLANVVKHAAASGVRITLEIDQPEVRLVVEDDGVGGVGSESGLVSLQDRVHALGGRLEVRSPPGGGTTLLAVVPLTGTMASSALAGVEEPADRSS